MANKDDSGVAAPTDVKFVGPATAAVLEDATFDAEDIPDKRVSHAMLVEAGVNAGVAARIRREYSLSWSFESSGGEDLARRANQVRGLGDAERAWVTASSGDWESADPPTETGATDGSGDTDAAEAAWRDRSKPVPVTDLDGIDDELGEHLAEGGIRSLRSLSLADPEEVASSLDLDVEAVERWQSMARDRV